MGVPHSTKKWMRHEPQCVIGYDAYECASPIGQHMIIQTAAGQGIPTEWIILTGQFGIAAYSGCLIMSLYGAYIP
jgi:hypothetical protein